MGNWAINIQGIGAHHNDNYEGDANKMAARFVSELIAAGHLVENASITFGGKENYLAEDTKVHPLCSASG